MNAQEKAAVLEAALERVGLEWDDVGQDGYITGTRMASDVAQDLVTELERRGFDLVQKADS